jgi:TRAP-type C4-dicarboxylate transport system permease small subunit
MYFTFRLLSRPNAIGIVPVVAQLQQLKEGFGTALVLVFFIGFFWGVFKIWAGANAISKGDSEGKSGILAGIIIAAAAAIMGALFTIFGMQDAVITPRF